MSLSPLAQHLAREIAMAPKQQVEAATLYEAAVTFDRSLATASTARVDISTALNELAGAGLVVLPSGKKHFDARELPPMPLWVRRPPRERPARQEPRVRVWPAALEVAGRMATSDNEFAVLDTVAAFLRNGGESRPSVPARERSLELFGDEKRLDRLVLTRLFTSGALTLGLLRCHLVPIPFVSQWVHGAGDPRGPALLIAENHHTYASLLEVARENAEEGGPGMHVGYGTGAQFPSAVLTVPLLDPLPERIVYFGDIDLKGLQIPAAANITAQRSGLPSVDPAVPLYELLFDAPYGRPADRIEPETATAAASWLGKLAQKGQDVLIAGRRLPQEAVGYELLTSRREVLSRI